FGSIHHAIQSQLQRGRGAAGIERAASLQIETHVRIRNTAGREAQGELELPRANSGCRGVRGVEQSEITIAQAEGAALRLCKRHEGEDQQQKKDWCKSFHGLVLLLTITLKIHSTLVNKTGWRS